MVSCAHVPGVRERRGCGSGRFGRGLGLSVVVVSVFSVLDIFFTDVEGSVVCGR